MEYWSWILAAIGVAGIYFVGKKTLWGWSVLLFNEAVWIIYAIITEQYGFIVSAFAYGAVYIKSYLHWKEDADGKNGRASRRRTNRRRSRRG
jgi:hypothetical protein